MLILIFIAIVAIGVGLLLGRKGIGIAVLIVVGLMMLGRYGGDDTAAPVPTTINR